MNNRKKTSQINSNQHTLVFFTKLKKFFQLLLIVSTPIFSGCLIVADEAVIFNNHLLNEKEILELAGGYQSIHDDGRAVILQISDTLESWFPPLKLTFSKETAPFTPTKPLQAIKFHIQMGDRKSASQFAGVAILS